MSLLALGCTVWCITLLLASSRAARITDEEKLIGWKGETYIPPDKLLLNTNSSSGKFDPDKDPWVEVISWKPRAFVYHKFLSDEECEHIIRTAAPQMKRSTVVGAHGESVEDPIRTSYGCFLRRMQDPVIERIEERLASWTNLPAVHQEDLQVLRYGIGQKYGAHFDSHEDENVPGPTGRVATVLLYLNDCEEGGETAFPSGSEWADPTMPDRFGPLSDCAKNHVAMKPKKGDALLFFSLKTDGVMDSAAMHTGCPVVKGLKWTSTKWIHTKPFRPEGFVKPTAEELPGDPGMCKDYHEMCPTWVAAGECEKNPGYMLGSAFAQGGCRRSCKGCRDCKAGDQACFNKNRADGGYLALDPTEFDQLHVQVSSISGGNL